MRIVATVAFVAVVALACCWSPARAACLHTASDLEAQVRASDVVLKALAMRVWPESDDGGPLAGHFAVMAVYKGARIVKNVLHIGGTDLFNIRDKWVNFCPRINFNFKLSQFTRSK